LSSKSFIPFRFINYQAVGREALEVKDLLDVEMGKTLWIWSLWMNYRTGRNSLS